MFRDPIEPEDIATLWDLTQQDDKVRVAFVRQLANDPSCCVASAPTRNPLRARSGCGGRMRPGRSSSSRARLRRERAVRHRHARSVRTRRPTPGPWPRWSRGSTRRWPMPPRRTSRGAINGLALKESSPTSSCGRSPKWSGSLARGSSRTAIEAARDRLRREITAAASTDQDASAACDGRWAARSRSGPDLSQEERLQAVRYLVPLLGQDIDSLVGQGDPARPDSAPAHARSPSQAPRS